MSRRSFLRSSALLALAAPVLPSLAACGSSSKKGSSVITIASPEKPVKWPIATDNQPIAEGMSPERNATLTLYNYADYIDPEALKSFEEKYKEYGVKVEVSTFNDQDEALAKLRARGSTFDIYFPSYDILGKLVTAGLVRPLTHAYIPNISNVWPEFQNPFYDQEWRYSLPYTVYTTGIGWRTDKISEDVGALENPYDVFWDTRYTGQMAILDDYREAICMVLLRNGIEDLNTGDPKQLETAKSQLLELTKTSKPKVTITGYTDIPEGRLGLSQAWSGDLINAVSYLPDGQDPGILRYWFPESGKGSVNNDLMVLLRSSRYPVMSHLFLDHMLDFDVAMGNFGAIGYQPPQTKIVPENLVQDEFIPENLASTIVLPKYFNEGFRELELPPETDAAWHAIWQQFKAGA
jgi:spermidine/putrescine transport system substrate-binding protein